MHVYGKYECFVMQMLYVCDLQFVNAGRGCKRRPYRRGILQSRSHDSLIGSHEGLLLLNHHVAVSAFIICSGLCACTEML